MTGASPALLALSFVLMAGIAAPLLIAEKVKRKLKRGT